VYISSDSTIAGIARLSDESALMTTIAPALLRTTFIAAVIALSSIGVGQPAIAKADPEWDIGAYDDCIANPNNTAGLYGVTYCCSISGGIMYGNKCVAPPAKAQGPAQGPEQTQTPAPPANNAPIQKQPPRALH
jgi:hypothetical protein